MDHDTPEEPSGGSYLVDPKTGTRTLLARTRVGPAEVARPEPVAEVPLPAAPASKRKGA